MTTMSTNIDAALLAGVFETALPYREYLATDLARSQPWEAIYDQVELDDAQRKLLTGFTRTVKALCVSGIWCGDCAQQGPLLERIAEASPAVDLRWIDRDEHAGFSERLKINAGLRVPMVVFMAEDHEPVSVFGDRTLARYRSIAQRQLGGACPLPGAPVPDEELRATLQDWLDEFERVHLLLRLSGRLRQTYGD
ncbi:MAG: thiol reductase thioredoxin [Planctomycetes bacterium]|nr:thiol reductase thioredoxin [Planctomycetota bacterium]